MTVLGAPVAASHSVPLLQGSVTLRTLTMPPRPVAVCDKAVPPAPPAPQSPGFRPLGQQRSASPSGDGFQRLRHFLTGHLLSPAEPTSRVCSLPVPPQLLAVSFLSPASLAVPAGRVGTRSVCLERAWGAEGVMVGVCPRGVPRLCPQAVQAESESLRPLQRGESPAGPRVQGPGALEGLGPR